MPACVSYRKMSQYDGLGDKLVPVGESGVWVILFNFLLYGSILKRLKRSVLKTERSVMSRRVGSNPTASAIFNLISLENCSKKEFPRGRAHRVLHYLKKAIVVCQRGVGQNECVKWRDEAIQLYWLPQRIQSQAAWYGLPYIREIVDEQHENVSMKPRFGFAFSREIAQASPEQELFQDLIWRNNYFIQEVLLCDINYFK